MPRQGIRINVQKGLQIIDTVSVTGIYEIATKSRMNSRSTLTDKSTTTYIPWAAKTNSQLHPAEMLIKFSVLKQVAELQQWLIAIQLRTDHEASTT